MSTTSAQIYDWHPIATYNDEPFTLFRDAVGRQVFGERQNCGWFELLSGELYQVEGFVPIAWATVPEEHWADFAFG